jgi:CTP:phosphocholine cytidylyltransferase-like protein
VGREQIKMEKNYPTVTEVLDEMQKTNPIGWNLTYEYPNSIGVWSIEFTSDDQFIMFGDVNGHFGFNDVPADKVVGSMENIYEPAEIVKSFWNQIANFYPDLVKMEDK